MGKGEAFGTVENGGLSVTSTVSRISAWQAIETNRSNSFTVFSQNFAVAYPWDSRSVLIYLTQTKRM